MAESTLPVSTLSNGTSDSSAIMSNTKGSAQRFKGSIHRLCNSLRHAFHGETGSIFAYEKFLWPKEESFKEIEKAVSGKCLPWTMHLVHAKSDRHPPSIHFKLNQDSNRIECELVECSQSIQIAQRCRGINLALQTQRSRWLQMKKIVEVTGKLKLVEKISSRVDQRLKLGSSSEVIFNTEQIESPEQLKTQLKILEDDLFKDLDEEYKSVGSDARHFIPGPVGDLPIHQCFVLDLKRIGMNIVDKYFSSSPDLINTPYTNDLDPWRKRKDPTRDFANQPFRKQREDGLYTGETILHIAIVKEDVDLVRQLLKRGACLSSRATGVFFQPRLLPVRVSELTAWQRAFSWAGGVDLSLPDSATMKHELNRHSGCYYGELPLSFAASVGNVEICQMLYDECKRRNSSAPQSRSGPAGELPPQGGPAAGEHGVADRMRSMLLSLNKHHAGVAGQPPATRGVWDFMTAADSFCNTAMHMAVIHQRREVVDWLMSIEAGRDCLQTLNCEGFTPLTLAVHEGNVGMFNHILYTHMSSVVWRYGRVRMRQTDLLQVDTFRLGGGDRPHLHSNPRWRSALEVIAAHEVQAFAEDAMFNRLIDDKWRRFGRRMYLRRTVAPYALLLAAYVACIVIRAVELRRDRDRGVGGADPGAAPRLYCVQDAAGWALAGSLDHDEGDSQGGDAGWRIVTLTLEGLLVLFGGPFLLWKGWRQRRLLLRDLDPNEDGRLTFHELRAFAYKNLHFLLDFAAAGALLAAGAGRLRCADRGELEALAVAGVLLWTNALNVLMPFKYIGVLVISVYKMLVGDIFRFLVVFGATLAGFACGALLLVQRAQGDEPAAAALSDTFLRLLWVALGDGLGNAPQGLESGALYLAMHITWVVLSSVLMLNLLIAMMGRTFDTDAEDTHSIWIFPFASLVLRYERMLSDDERRRHRTGSAAAAGGPAALSPRAAGAGADAPHASGDAAGGTVAGEGGGAPRKAGDGGGPGAAAQVASAAELRYVDIDVGEVGPAEEDAERRAARARAESQAAHGPLLDLVRELVDDRLADLRRDLLRGFLAALRPGLDPTATAAAAERAWSDAGGGGGGGDDDIDGGCGGGCGGGGAGRGGSTAAPLPPHVEATGTLATTPLARRPAAISD